MKVVFKRCYDISKVILMATSALWETQSKIINTDHSWETTACYRLWTFKNAKLQETEKDAEGKYSCIHVSYSCDREKEVKVTQ